MIPLFVALFLLWAAAPALAGAKATVVLRPEATVPGPQITLGEIATVRSSADGLAARLRALDLGTAAAPGQARVIDRAALGQRLRQAESNVVVELVGTERVLVLTDALTIPAETLLETARRWLLERLQADPAQTLLTPLSVPRPLVLPRGHPTVRVQPGAPIQDGPVTLTVEAAVIDQSGQRTARYAQVAFQLERLRRVVVATRPLQRKRVISSVDVRVENRSGTQILADALTDAADAVGKEIVREVTTGEVLTAGALRIPIVLRRGTPVLLLLDGPGFRITARGVALEEGGVGQMIRIMNQSSRKEIHGRVENDGSVRVPF